MIRGSVRSGSPEASSAPCPLLTTIATVRRKRCGVTFSIPALFVTSRRSRRTLFVVCGVPTRVPSRSASGSVSSLPVSYTHLESMLCSDGSSQSSHQRSPDFGGSPSDCQRSSRMAWRILEILATRARFAGLPSGVSHLSSDAFVIFFSSCLLYTSRCV